MAYRSMKSIAKELCDAYFETDVEIDKTSRENSDVFIARVKYYNQSFEGEKHLHYVRISRAFVLGGHNDEPGVEIPNTNLSWQILDDDCIDDL